jgi:hypothetical protein
MLLCSDILVIGSGLYEIKTSPYGKLETKSYSIPREMGRYCFIVVTLRRVNPLDRKSVV